MLCLFAEPKSYHKKPAFMKATISYRSLRKYYVGIWMLMVENI